MVGMEESNSFLKVTDTGLKEPYKILIAEDNEMNQKIVTMMLRKAGLNFDVANNGEEAVKAYKSYHYDMILMDCQMPILDGYEATKKIREIQKKHIPIIAVTAHAFQEAMEKCVSCGMDDFLCKPLSNEKLIETIKKHLNITNPN